MSNTIRHAVILAAGRGTRMMPLTNAIPKPMAPYLDTTLIGHGIEKVRKYIHNIHVTVGYKGAMLAQHLMELGISSIHNTDGQSNSWWLHHTLIGGLDEPTFVLTCDNVTDLDFEQLSNDYYASGAPPCMVVPVRPIPGLAGDFIFHEDGVVTKLDRNEPSDIYCSGIQVINPTAVRAVTKPDGEFYQIWDALIARRELRVSNVLPRKWFTVDTLHDLARVSESESA